MNWVMISFTVATIILYSIVYLKNPSNVKTAFNSTLYQLFHPQQGFLYLIIAAFLISSMLVLILPKEQISAWLGKESGLRGISIGTALGALTPGGPFLTFPILVGFWKAGTGIGVIIAYLTSWSLLGVQRILVWELPFFGPKFVLVRVVISLITPIILRFLGPWVFDLLDLE
ncbi:MAG: permease [Candidatus Aenigmatarchaeota archaeon]